MGTTSLKLNNQNLIKVITHSFSQENSVIYRQMYTLFFNLWMKQSLIILSRRIEKGCIVVVEPETRAYDHPVIIHILSSQTMK